MLNRLHPISGATARRIHAIARDQRAIRNAIAAPVVRFEQPANVGDSACAHFAPEGRCVFCGATA